MLGTNSSTDDWDILGDNKGTGNDSDNGGNDKTGTDTTDDVTGTGSDFDNGNSGTDAIEGVTRPQLRQGDGTPKHFDQRGNYVAVNDSDKTGNEQTGTDATTTGNCDTTVHITGTGSDRCYWG